jgi:hypothetical protein
MIFEDRMSVGRGIYGGFLRKRESGEMKAG